MLLFFSSADVLHLRAFLGPVFASLPFLQEPVLTFLQNSQNFWFNNMGNGTRMDPAGEVGPGMLVTLTLLKCSGKKVPEPDRHAASE